MKQILTIILVAFCLVSFAQRQKKNKAADDVYVTSNEKDSNQLPDAPKKAWKIIVKNNLTADENFALVGRSLIENDFTIESKDKDFGTIQTGKKEIFKSRSGSYLLNVSVKENLITITGQLSTDIELVLYGVKSTNALMKIENKGLPGDTRIAAFKKMQTFALLLGPDLEYIVN